MESDTRAQTDGDAERGTHFYLITMEFVTPEGGRRLMSQDGTFTPPWRRTRLDACAALRKQLAARYPEWTAGATLFFDVQPNRI